MEALGDERKCHPWLHPVFPLAGDVIAALQMAMLAGLPFARLAEAAFARPKMEKD
jgi:hypothetical protein